MCMYKLESCTRDITGGTYVCRRGRKVGVGVVPIIALRQIKVIILCRRGEWVWFLL